LIAGEGIAGLLLAVGVGMALPLGGRAAEPSDGLLACRALADPSARLACFDREAALLASVPAANREAALLASVPAANREAALPASVPAANREAAPAGGQQVAPGPGPALPPAAPSRSPPSAPLDPQQQFGLPEHAVAAREVAAGTRATDAAKIEAHLVRLAQAPDGRWIFTLDNQQVWRELASEGDLLAKPGDAVTISRAFLGSYWLQAPTGRGCKVTRVR
jgi:hypothetical protein